MEEVRYSPEERIITVTNYSFDSLKMGQYDDCALYIITKGDIEIVFEGVNNIGERVKKNTLANLQSGELFGELAFFTG